MDPRTPVLVGVGVAHRPVDGSAAVAPMELTADAALAAIADAGAVGSLAARIDTVAVTVGNWELPDPGRELARRIGAGEVRSIRADVGVLQQRPVSAAIERIRSGAADVVLVAGGEAMASRRAAERAGREPPADEVLVTDTVPDEHWQHDAASGDLVAAAEIESGLWAPVEQYACIEVARGAAHGWTREQHSADIGALWSAFDRVAGTNPAADFAGDRTASFLTTPSPDNRPIAHPYNRWSVSQWSVDQAAALLLCSAATAADLGVPSDRWVFCRVALESSSAVSLSNRSALHRWPAMSVLGRAATDHLGSPLAEIEHVECYSCFPVAVRVQQQELGLDPAGVPTVTGGMTFAGGPFNNATYQATAPLVERLRSQPGTSGLLTTVSGLLTKPALVVWSATPGPHELVADLAEAARRSTATVPSTSNAHGPATVATATATYEGLEPVRAVVLADLADGTRWVGSSTDPAVVAATVGGTVVGSAVVVDGTTCHT